MNEIYDHLSTVCFSIFNLSWMDSEIKRLRYVVRQIEDQMNLMPPGSPHLEKAGNTYAIRVLTGHRSDCSRKQTYMSLKDTLNSGSKTCTLRRDAITKNSFVNVDSTAVVEKEAAKDSATRVPADNLAACTAIAGENVQSHAAEEVVKSHVAGEAALSHAAEEANQSRDRIANTPEVVDAYANKLYLSRLLPILKNELDVLVFLQKEYHPERKFDVYSGLPDEARRRVCPAVMRSWERGAEWEKAKFPRNPYPFDDSKGLLITKKEERVRSRIELLIANCLFDAGIPYRYECKYILPDDSVIYPDFTIMHPKTGKLYYLEYFGRMDDLVYQEKAYEKIRQFQLTKDAAHFICFMESSANPLNIQAITNTLNAYFGEEGK